MTTFPGSPRLLKGGIVLLNPTSGAMQRIIALQYNPDTLTRTLQVQGVGTEGGDRCEAMRLKGPPVETLRVEAEIDATDLLELARRSVREIGIHAQLAVLETMVYPTSAQLPSNRGWLSPARWRSRPCRRRSRSSCGASSASCRCASRSSASPRRRSTRCSTPFAPRSLGLRVLSVDDLGFDHKAAACS